MVAAGAIPADYTVLDGDGDDPPPDDDPVISQAQRQELFKMAHDRFGQAEGNKIILRLIGEHGLKSTNGMTTSTYNTVVASLTQIIESMVEEGGEGNPDQDPKPGQDPKPNEGQ